MEPGDRVIWQHEMRGGYGWVEAVPVVVVRLTAQRIRIRALRLTGALAERSVHPEHIRAATDAELCTHAGIYRVIEREKWGATV